MSLYTLHDKMQSRDLFLIASILLGILNIALLFFLFLVRLQFFVTLFVVFQFIILEEHIRELSFNILKTFKNFFFNGFTKIFCECCKPSGMWNCRCTLDLSLVKHEMFWSIFENCRFVHKYLNAYCGLLWCQNLDYKLNHFRRSQIPLHIHKFISF